MSIISTLSLVAFSFAPTAALNQTPATPAAPAAQTAAAPAAAATPQVPTPESAAAFIGDWTVTADGPQGQFVSLLTIKVDAGKVVAELSSDMIPKTVITNIMKTGPALVMKYTLDFQGNAVPAGLTVTPNGEKANVTFDFADGQFTMPGTGVKKK